MFAWVRARSSRTTKTSEIRERPLPLRWKILLAIPMLVLSTHSIESYSSTAEGEFIGRVIVEWLNEEGADRDMRLVEDFGYRDPSGRIWSVPAGAVVDGASIPLSLYSLIGPPFVGDYRRATVIHDYYCTQELGDWRDVHRVFFEASRTGGVPLLRAKLMYAAVQGWGPRWEHTMTRGGPAKTISIPRPTPEPSDLIDIESLINESDPSLEEIDRLLAERLGEPIDGPGF